MNIREIIDLIEGWVEGYENNTIVLRNSDGTLPTHLYRYMSQKEFDLAQRRGAFYPKPGERIHASEEPEHRYIEPGSSILVQFTYHEEDGWRPKWGDKLYAVSDGPIPFDHATVI